MHLLITGGTGFIGRHLTLHALAAGHDVTLLVREAYGMGTPLPAPLAAKRAALQLVYADLRQNSLTRKAVATANADAVVHLAAAGVTNPFLPPNEAIRHNVNGVIHLMRAVFETTSAQRMIMARTPGERTAMNMYATSKAAGWQFVRHYAKTEQWPLIGAMIFQAYGEGQPERTLIPSAIRAAVDNEDFPMTSGRQMRDWIHVSDVCHGIMAAVSADLPAATTVELGSGIPTSLIDTVNTIYRLAGSHGHPLPGAIPDRKGEDQVQIANPEKMIISPQLTFAAGIGRLLASTQHNSRK